MARKIFYKKRMQPTEEGLEIITEEWVSLRETECFHFCVPRGETGLLRVLANSGESELDVARRRKTLKRIAKTRSRFAFETESQALEHLKLLKRKQFKHMQRDLQFIEAFLNAERLEKSGYGEKVPGSRDLVHQHYIFD